MQVVSVAATAKTAAEMKTAGFASLLGNAWKAGCRIGWEDHQQWLSYLVNAAPAADTPAAGPLSVQILIANWDAKTYQFIKPAVPFTVKAEGENITAEQVMQAAQAAGQMTYSAEQSSTGNIHQSHQR